MINFKLLYFCAPNMLLMEAMWYLSLLRQIQVEGFVVLYKQSIFIYEAVYEKYIGTLFTNLVQFSSNVFIW